MVFGLQVSKSDQSLYASVIIQYIIINIRMCYTLRCFIHRFELLDLVYFMGYSDGCQVSTGRRLPAGCLVNRIM